MATEILNNSESRERAASYVKVLAPTPSVFAAAVRLLVNDAFKFNGELRPVTKLMVSQALRGKKILAMLYYAALRLTPKHLEGKAHLSLGDMINGFAPYDLACLYATFLLYRRSRKQLELDMAGFAELLPRFRPNSIICGLVGSAIPAIGVGSAILGGVLNDLALAVIAFSERTKVREYMHYLEGRSLTHEHAKEMEEFGCSVHQVGTVLLSRLGFSSRIAESYLRSANNSIEGEDPDSKRACAMKFSRLWLEALRSNLDQPAIAIPGDYYPLAKHKVELLEQVKQAKEGAVSWFERGEEDISPETTPLLFNAQEQGREVPQELRDIFSMREISDMDEEEFDALIDEIDRNIDKGTLETVLSGTEIEP